ncbi:uncharacterized protein C8R40DRAFT_1265677 [Lentinula edodes]|uniref:uncharacterized protein n=1 Tax=Lentinula edodes TaxID=5353 RepID=UPI001E8E53AE|nr:uncharacterized protein C8R40DRAFT_1265677 [Lentinula edodes]KAH7874300.1 hypothetical protein C8R40DRAFT_1265677 [Lentinula edodes]
MSLWTIFLIPKQPQQASHLREQILLRTGTAVYIMALLWPYAVGAGRHTSEGGPEDVASAVLGDTGKILGAKGSKVITETKFEWREELDRSSKAGVPDTDDDILAATEFDSVGLPDLIMTRGRTREGRSDWWRERKYIHGTSKCGGNQQQNGGYPSATGTSERILITVVDTAFMSHERARSRLELEGSYENRDRGREGPSSGWNDEMVTLEGFLGGPGRSLMRREVRDECGTGYAREGRSLGTRLEDGRPRVWEVVTEKQYVVRHRGPEAYEVARELWEVWGRVAHQAGRRWGALVMFEGARGLTRKA